MAYQLPIVGSIEDGGVRFLVRALPWGLAREASRPNSDTEAISAKIYARCVEVEDGEKPEIDELPASLVGRLVEMAANAKADGAAANPPSPTNSTAPASVGSSVSTNSP